MTMMARVTGGAVAEVREIEPDSIPEHKRALWWRAIGEPPGEAVRHLYSGPEHRVAGDAVQAVWTPRPLADVRREALARVEAGAAAARAKLVTPGKDGVYIQKQSEARACIDDPNRTELQDHPVSGARIARYPHLEALIGPRVPATGDRSADLLAAARYILGKAADLKGASAAIEQRCDAAKAAILKADSVESVWAASEVAWA